MCNYFLIFVFLVSACTARQPSVPVEQITPRTAAVALTQAPCTRLPSEFGALPSDGVDDRVALQAWLNACAGLRAQLTTGTWDVVTPIVPRAITMLTVPAGTMLEGFGLDVVLRFSGDNGKRDWTGLLPGGDGVSMSRMRFETAFTAGTTVEQTHVVRVIGQLRGFHLSHFTCDHLPEGSKSGDCIQLVGYSPDRLMYDIEIDHGIFLRSGRSGIGLHSGLRGTLAGEHMTSRFHDNVFVSMRTPDIDGEGSGDVVGLEIDHNEHRMPAVPGSAISIEIQGATNVWMHDIVSHGRGFGLYGCDGCRFDHNTVEQIVPGVSTVTLWQTGSGTSFSDERYSRTDDAGALPVLQVSHRIGAPRDVSVRDSVMTHHAGPSALQFVGIQGVAISDIVVTYDGPPGVADAVSVIGSGQAGGILCDGVAGIRSTNVEVSDLSAVGPHRAVVKTSGSYCGVGSLSVRRTKSTQAAQGLRCEGVSTGAGITGPIVLAGNAMPVNACAGY